MRHIRKIVKFVFFLLFTIGAVGFSKALFHVIIHPDKQWFSSSNLFILIGFAVYLPVHVIFHRLIVLHVFGHEITHVIWSMIFGGKMHELYVSRDNGGYTRYSRGNFLVTLAPYFFPLYAIIFMVLHLIVAAEFKPYIDFLLGFSISFHIMLTLYSIRLDQPDLRRSGLGFSLVFAYMMNCIVIGLIVCVVMDENAGVFFRDGMRIYKEIGPAFVDLGHWTAKHVINPLHDTLRNLGVGLDGFLDRAAKR